MRMISLATLSAALMISVPVAAKTQPTDEQTVAKAGTEDKKICKKLTITGSRNGERVCLTRDQWKKVEDVK